MTVKTRAQLQTDIDALLTANGAGGITGPLLNTLIENLTDSLDSFKDIRVGTTGSSATPTPNCDTDEVYTVTALAAGATFGAPTGTPVNGQKLIIRVKDNGTARTLAFNAIYRAMGTALPTTTVISKTLYMGFIYNSADSKWDLVAMAQEA